MTLNDNDVPHNELPDIFADFFKNKVKAIVDSQKITYLVYNGTRKLQTTDHHFMSLNNINAAVKTLKSKNCEGHDRIPRKILKDGIDILKFPLSYLCNQIYQQKIFQNNG